MKGNQGEAKRFQPGLSFTGSLDGRVPGYTIAYFYIIFRQLNYSGVIMVIAAASRSLNVRRADT
jgi:hypothetical protein